MPDPEKARARELFIEFVAGFYRHAGTDPPYFDFDETEPIAFEATVDDVRFTVGYDPVAGDSNLFVHCVFGTMPPHQDAAVLRRLMARNLALARKHNATYCLDDATQEIACYLRLSLAQVDVQALHQEMLGIAQQAQRWRESWFLADDEDDAGQNGINDPVAWAILA